MVTILKYRVAFITLLFGLFGGALSLLLKVDELQNYYPSLAMLIALSISLLISFLIKAKWNVSFRNTLKKVATILFLLFLVAAFFHTYFLINSVFKYKDFDHNTSLYVKGSELTAAAIKCRKDHPTITSDAAMMTTCFEGPESKADAWTQDSINNNIMKLIISYCMVILFFVSTISLLAEVLSSKYTKTTKPKSQDKL